MSVLKQPFDQRNGMTIITLTRSLSLSLSLSLSHLHTHCCSVAPNFVSSSGSALFKSLSPAILSSIIYIILYYFSPLGHNEIRILLHPYPMGALIAALTFLLSFRANFAYDRYWGT